MSTITNGKWKIQFNKRSNMPTGIMCGGRKIINFGPIGTHLTRKEKLDIARLVAAAPTLLTACELARDWLAPGHSRGVSSMISAALESISNPKTGPLNRKETFFYVLDAIEKAEKG